MHKLSFALVVCFLVNSTPLAAVPAHGDDYLGKVESEKGRRGTTESQRIEKKREAERECRAKGIPLNRCFQNSTAPTPTQPPSVTTSTNKGTVEKMPEHDIAEPIVLEDEPVQDSLSDADILPGGPKVVDGNGELGHP